MKPMHMTYRWWEDKLVLREGAVTNTYDLTDQTDDKIRDIIGKLTGKTVAGYGIRGMADRLAQLAKKYDIDTSTWEFEMEDTRDELDYPTMSVWNLFDDYLSVDEEPEVSRENIEVELRLWQQVREMENEQLGAGRA